MYEVAQEVMIISNVSAFSSFPSNHISVASKEAGNILRITKTTDNNRWGRCYELESETQYESWGTDHIRFWVTEDMLGYPDGKVPPPRNYFKELKDKDRQF